MGEREIGCCGAGGWAKVIAWLQIVLSALFLIVCGIGLGSVIGLGPEKFQEAVKDTVLGSDGDSAYAIAVTIQVLSIAVFGIAVMMGGVLLKGSKERNTRYLRWWIIYVIITMVWEAIIVIFAILSTTDNLGVSLFLLIFALALDCFGIWVVRVHVKEIENQCAPAAYGAPPAYGDPAAYGGPSQYGKGP